MAKKTVRYRAVNEIRFAPGEKGVVAPGETIPTKVAGSVDFDTEALLERGVIAPLTGIITDDDEPAPAPKPKAAKEPAAKPKEPAAPAPGTDTDNDGGTGTEGGSGTGNETGGAAA